MVDAWDQEDEPDTRILHHVAERIEPTKPAGSPFGETSISPSALALAMSTNGDCAMNAAATSSMNEMTLASALPLGGLTTSLSSASEVTTS
jgi:hypothetical protein